MATVLTSKTYCDRPGCGGEVDQFDSGQIRFSVYVNRRGYGIPDNNKRGTADLCRACSIDLDKFWNAKKQ